MNFSQLDWNAIYLTCLGVGLALGALSLSGALWPLHFGSSRYADRPFTGHGNPSSLSDPFRSGAANGVAVVTFLCWFGAVGAAMLRAGALVPAMVAAFAAVSGLVGATLVQWMLARVVLARRPPEVLPTDADLVGVTGRVTAAIPPRGIGEMLFHDNGCRRTLPIRAENGGVIPHDAEVVVMRMARGCALVRRWDEFEHSLLGDEPLTRNIE